MLGNTDGVQAVYDPRGIVAAVATPTAARVASLDGLRLAVLDNTKWNGNRLLRRIAATLEKTHDLAAVHYYAKESFSTIAAPELIDEIVANNDIALTAIGD